MDLSRVNPFKDVPHQKKKPCRSKVITGHMSTLVVDLAKAYFISVCVEAAKADARRTRVQMNHTQVKKCRRESNISIQDVKVTLCNSHP